MDDFEAFRQKKLGKKAAPGPAKPAAGGDDFEAFRRAKMQKKQQAESAELQKSYEHAVEEEGKAKGLLSHRTRQKKVAAEGIPRVQGYSSHISRAEVDPASIEKYGGKRALGDDIQKIDPDSVRKVDVVSHRQERERVDPDSIPKANIVSHVEKVEKVDPDSIPKARGLKRY